MRSPSTRQVCSSHCHCPAGPQVLWGGDGQQVGSSNPRIWDPHHQPGPCSSPKDRNEPKTHQGCSNQQGLEMSPGRSCAALSREHCTAHGGPGRGGRGVPMGSLQPCSPHIPSNARHPAPLPAVRAPGTLFPFMEPICGQSSPAHRSPSPSPPPRWGHSTAQTPIPTISPSQEPSHIPAIAFSPTSPHRGQIPRPRLEQAV